MKKIRVIASLFTLFFILYGCIEVVYEITVDDKNNEISVVKIGFPTMFETEDELLKEVISGYRDDGYSFLSEVKGDTVWMIGRKEFPPGKWVFPSLENDVEIIDTTSYDFYVVDYHLFQIYCLDIEYDYVEKGGAGESVETKEMENPGEPEGYEGGAETGVTEEKGEALVEMNEIFGEDFEEMMEIKVKFVVSLPGETIMTNADNPNEGTPTWEYTLGGKGKVDIELVTIN